MASQQEEDFAALVEKMNRLEKENEDLRRKLEEKEMGGVKEQESVAPGVSLQVEVEVEGLTFLPSDASCGEERDEKVKVVGKDDDQKMSDDKDEKVDEDSGESIVVLDGIHELLERKEELPKEEIHDPGLQGLSPVSVEKILLFPDDEEDNKEEPMTKPCPNCAIPLTKASTKGGPLNNNICCNSCKIQWCWLCDGKIPGKKALPEHFRSGPCEGLQFQKANSRKEAREQQEKKEEWIRNHKFRYYGHKVLMGVLLAPVIIVAGVLVLVIGMVVLFLSLFYFGCKQNDSTPLPDDPEGANET